MASRGDSADELVFAIGVSLFVAFVSFGKKDVRSTLNVLDMLYDDDVRIGVCVCVYAHSRDRQLQSQSRLRSSTPRRNLIECVYYCYSRECDGHSTNCVRDGASNERTISNYQFDLWINLHWTEKSKSTLSLAKRNPLAHRRRWRRPGDLLIDLELRLNWEY